jgi:hypothetical protein
MPYGLIVTVVAVALSAVYVFASEESTGSKGLVAGLLAVSFLWRYGIFLRVGLGVGLSLYFTYVKSR